jgi:hypothetical protein
MRNATMALLVGSGSLLLQSCPLGRIIDCYGEDTISASEYEDLNSFEQLAYEENWCGRYERRSGLLGDLF